MAYVIEEISEEDYEKYNLDEEMIFSSASYWAIDRKREIWLREHHENTDGDFPGEGEILSIEWGFYYNGYLIFIEIEPIETKFNHEKKELYKHIRFIKMYCRIPNGKLFKCELPKELEDKKEEILKEFKKALEESCGDPYFGLRRKEKGETCRADLEYNGKII
ncbi:MAG: hypothetical protein LBG67_05440 [Campylobacteraceae bacterium]|nr:hypothetical protein [Campylobacteraceae bacterium]